jgi:hypothetical protein
LARPAADGNPQPAFVNFSQDKRLHFIQLQDIILLSQEASSSLRSSAGKDAAARTARLLQSLH